MSYPVLEQMAYVIMRDGCSVRVAIEQDDCVEIACGRSGREQFEFVLYREVLGGDRRPRGRGAAQDGCRRAVGVTLPRRHGSRRRGRAPGQAFWAPFQIS